MFVLTQVSPKKGVQSNTALGNRYSLVRQDADSTEFERIVNECFSGKPKNGEYAFVVTEGGKKIIPLFEDERNYIMTASGATFEEVYK